MVGITSYGTYIPRYRLRLADIAAAWRKPAEDIVSSLHISEKSVPAVDEDAVTMAMEAASQAILCSGIQKTDIGALFVGSESHPYAVNPTSTIVGELLGIGNQYVAADLEFACKAGTAGMVAVAAMVRSGGITAGLAIGSDTAQSKPHDALEYTSAAAGVAIMLGNTACIAELVESASFSSDTPDFWRRDGIRYPSHAGRFTGEPAYFAHVSGAAKLLMGKAAITPEDVTYCVFHMPNGKFPRDVARRLGFSKDQLAASLTVDAIGNPYSASSMLGLAAVLDSAKPGDTVFMVSYGSGAGSDAFFFRVTDAILPLQERRRSRHITVREFIENKVYISYTEYLKKTHKI